jgi:hypothetical protein
MSFGAAVGFGAAVVSAADSAAGVVVAYEADAVSQVIISAGACRHWHRHAGAGTGVTPGL